MKKIDRKVKTRAVWVEVYNSLGSISKAALKCGIARSTLYRWVKRSKQEQDLIDYSHRPKKLAHQKINSELEALILSARQNYGFGPQRIAIKCSECSETSHLKQNSFVFHTLAISQSIM